MVREPQTLPSIQSSRAAAPSNWWSGLSLRGKLDLLLVLSLLPIVLIVVVLGQVADRTNDASNQAARYRTLVFTVDDVRTAALDMETGLRGYALSGDESFLEPFNSGAQTAAAKLQVLESSGLFLENITTLKTSIASYKAWAAESLERIRRGEIASATTRGVLFENGKQRFDTLRSLMRDLETEASSAFDRARHVAVTGIATTQVLPWAILLVLALGMLVMRLGLMRLIVNPLKLLESSTRSLAEKEEYTALRVNSSDEIGRLQETLNRTAETLRARTEDLRRSNHELEQFAYVASHDLQEPLRMVSSYTQLLAKRYKGKLDDKADTYIYYAVDGANRMAALIQDLLAYSRVGSRREPLEAVDSAKVVTTVLKSLEVAVRESSADIKVGALPTVLADPLQLPQLFQNLIGNALKFRRTDVQHEVSVHARAVDGWWQFTVEDNGIGIHPEYFERIFVIFQRLHTRESFSGSGIGLAICKKIVERHGGRMWVESQPDRGSRFHFSLPSVGKES